MVAANDGDERPLGEVNRTQRRRSSGRRITALFGVTGLFLAVAIAVASFVSPTWTPGRIATAARVGDRAALERLVDFDAVRRSLEEDMRSVAVGHVQREMLSGDDELAVLFAGMASDAAGAVASEMVRQLITPANLERAVRGDPVWVDVLGERTNVIPASGLEGSTNPRQLKGEYLGFSTYVLRFTSPDGDGRVDVFLKRSGLFSWQVVRVSPDDEMLSLNDELSSSGSSERIAPTSSNVSDQIAEHGLDSDMLSISQPDGTSDDTDPVSDLFESYCGDYVDFERSECWEREAQNQDRLLNLEYNSLRSSLSAEGRDRLKQLQLSWIDRRDEACADPDGGGYGGWTGSYCIARETAERRLFLASYAE